MSCIVCGKSNVILFNVGSNNGKINPIVWDVFKEIYGEEVKPYLLPDSCICNVCMNILDNVGKLIRYIWNVISDPHTQPRPTKFNNFWKIFATLKLEKDDINKEDLLVESFSVPYNKNLEEQIAERERMKSLSIPPASEKSIRVKLKKNFPAANSVKGTTEGESDRESEVYKIFKRHKRRGHNWAKKKGGRSRSVTSSVSRKSRKSRRKTYTPFTDYSGFSCCTETSFPKRKLPAPSFSRATMHTRSLSRMENKVMSIYCTVENCNMFSDDIEELNLHNIEEHAMFNVYNCLECSNVYTTSYLFNLHMNRHKLSVFCLMCGMGQQNAIELQKHLDQHLDYSVPCIYCDKSFLKNSIREEHIRHRHKGRRNRRIYKDRQIILDRIDKTDRNEEQPYVSKPDYEARFIFYTDMQVEDGDMDMAIDNLKIRNIPVYTDEDEGITSEKEVVRTEEPKMVNGDISETENFPIQENVSVPTVEENSDEP